MTLGEYNALRGWDIPKNEDPAKEGYLVEYPLTGDEKPNHFEFSGYISWSPKAPFEAAYATNGSLPFSAIIGALESGKLCYRSGWNGTGMRVFKQVPSKIDPEIVPKMTSLSDMVKECLMIRKQGPNYRNQLALLQQDGTVDSWVPSVSDIFSRDWSIA